MNTFFIKFFREISLPESETLSSLAYDGNRIYCVNTRGDTIYMLSNSGTNLREIYPEQPIHFLAYDRRNLRFVGYDLDAPEKISILDQSYNTINDIILQYELAPLGEVQDITYNLQSDTITVVQPQNSTAVEDSGNVINNIHLQTSLYHTSNVSGAYIFSGIVNGQTNYITKTDLAGNILSYYQTPENTALISLAIQGADVYRTNYFALFTDGTRFFLANLCFSNPVPADFQVPASNNVWNFDTGGTVAPPAGEPPAYNPAPASIPMPAYNPRAYVPNFANAAQVPSTASFGGLLDAMIPAYNGGVGVGGRSCPTVSSFFAFTSLLVCDWEDPRDYCQVPSSVLNITNPKEIYAYDQCVYEVEREIQGDNLELMIYIFALIIAIKSQQAEARKKRYLEKQAHSKQEQAPCCPDFGDAAFYENYHSVGAQGMGNGGGVFTNNPILF